MSPAPNIIYNHPKSLVDFEKVYNEEYALELQSCAKWIKWCEDRGDTHGMNFHQGMRSAHIFNEIKMRQLIRILKKEFPNA